MKPTKERLLNAAGELFAEKGFHTTSVREICERARANLASVNYHFRSKEKLYEAVVLETFNYAIEKYPGDLDRDKVRSPEERLFVFVHRFLMRRLDTDRPAWHLKVLRREHAEPGPALHAVFKKVIRKNQEELLAILRDLIGPRADQQYLRLCMSSIAGQCLYYDIGRLAMGRLAKHIDFSPSGIEKLARHITDFSLSAIRNMQTAKMSRRSKTA